MDFVRPNTIPESAHGMEEIAVLSIPHTCGKSCSCMNPNAKENQKTKHQVKYNRKKSRAKYRHLALSRYTFMN